MDINILIDYKDLQNKPQARIPPFPQKQSDWVTKTDSLLTNRGKPNDEPPT